MEFITEQNPDTFELMTDFQPPFSEVKANKGVLSIWETDRLDNLPTALQGYGPQKTLEEANTMFLSYLRAQYLKNNLKVSHLSGNKYKFTFDKSNISDEDYIDYLSIPLNFLTKEKYNFISYSLNIPIFYDYNEIKDKAVENPFYYRFNPEYEFFDSQYELLISRYITKIKELDRYLPNLYLETNKEKTKEDIQDQFLKMLKINSEQNPIRTIGNVEIDESVDKSKIIISHEDVDLVNNSNDLKRMFPMYIDLEISTTGKSTLGAMLEEAGMSKLWIDDIIKTFANIKEEEKTFLDGTKIKIQKLYSMNPDKFEPNKILEAGVYLQNSNTQVNPFEQFIKNKKFKSNLGKYLSQNYMKPEDILKGNNASSELLFYRIDKYIKAQNEPIQSFYFANSSKLDVIRYTDTQVRYGSIYSYQIIGYYLIQTADYVWSDKQLVDDLLTFNMSVNQNFMLVGVPLTGKIERQVLDYPPNCPDVHMISFYGNKKNIAFNFSQVIGEVKIDPSLYGGAETQENLISFLIQNFGVGEVGSNPYNNFIIDQSDLEYLQDPRKAHPEDDGYIFGGDDYAKSYWIYRTDIAPLSYRSFANKKIVEVNNPAASFIDDIEANKNYYYIFRTLDSHNHLSYPTEVYRVKLVNNDGAIYLESEIVSFEQNKVKEDIVKPCKRYVMIAPSYNQSKLNLELVERSSAANIEGSNITYGDEDIEEKTVGENFKIRLTSAKTGRKIEIALKCGKIHSNFINEE